MPGAENLKRSDTVLSFIKHVYSKGGYVGAICAAPIVLAHAGILYGKKVTSYPGYEPELEGATSTGAPVEVDGTVITGKGPGCAIPFALEIVRILSGEKAMAELRKSMQVI
jgi:4-methyl-5(b-hydroxyethyl)-thiazole monophosphate biosynthesis